VQEGAYPAGQTIDIYGSVSTQDADAAYYGNFSFSNPSVNGAPTDLGDPSFFTPSNGGFGPLGALTPSAAPVTILLGQFNVSSFYDYLANNNLVTPYGSPTQTYQTSFDFSLDELDANYNTTPDPGSTVLLDGPALVVTGAVYLPPVNGQVPEPGAVAFLIAGGCTGIGFLRRRRG